LTVLVTSQRAASGWLFSHPCNDAQSLPLHLDQGFYGRGFWLDFSFN
jgi:hypothetical protein